MVGDAARKPARAASAPREREQPIVAVAQQRFDALAPGETAPRGVDERVLLDVAPEALELEVERRLEEEPGRNTAESLR